MLTDSRTNNLSAWPAGMPDGWYSTNETAVAQQIITAFQTFIPSVLLAPYMVHNPAQGQFRVALYIGSEPYSNAIPTSRTLLDLHAAGIYIQTTASNYWIKRIFGSILLGALIVHEWGHLVDFNPGIMGIYGVTNISNKADLAAMWATVNAGLPAGTYAKTNSFEWWAELFDGYLRDRKKVGWAINKRDTTGDPVWLADPNVASVLAMLNTYIPYPNNQYFRPTVTLGLDPAGAGGRPLWFTSTSAESITLTNGLEANPTVSAYLWERKIISGGVVTTSTVGTTATLTTTLPTGLALGSTVSYAVSGQNYLGWGEPSFLCTFTVVADNSNYAGIHQALPSRAPKATMLSVGAVWHGSGYIVWQYRNTVQTDPTAGWINAGIYATTYTPPADALSVRVHVYWASNEYNSNVCILT